MCMPHACSYLMCSIHVRISDIKECSIGTHNCSQLCIELDGGYRCGCYDGYELEKDGIACKGIKSY